MPVSVQQFAQAIRKKYPGSYASVPDEQLARAFVKRYPAYASQVNFGASAPAATADWQPADTKAPVNARFPSLGHGGYSAADFLMKLLPAAGSTGGALVGSGVASVPGAAAGAVLGSDAEKWLQNVFYKGLPKETEGEAAKDLTTQAALGAGSELGARGVSALIGRMAKPFAKSAETTAAADAGVGVRLTPGEATGNRMMQLGESVLEHSPGSSGVMHGFRSAQEADTVELLNRTLDDLSKRQLSGEEAGKAVQQAVQQAKNQTQVGDKFDEVRRLLGKKPGEYITPEEFDRLVAKEEKSTVLDASGKPVPSANGRSARKALEEARSAAKQANDRVDVELVGKILQQQNPELIRGYVTTAGLSDLRRLQQLLPAGTREDLARNVLQDMITKARDPQTGTVAARDLSASLKKLGEGRGRLIFGKQYEAVREASNLLNRINQSAQQSMIGRMHAARLMQGALIATMGILGFEGKFGAAAGLMAGEAGFSWALAKALTNPKTTAAALGILRGAAVSAARGIPYAANAAVQSSPAVYPDQDFGVQLPGGGKQ